MPEPSVVTDIELYFVGSEQPVSFSSDAPRALQQVVDGEAVYQVVRPDGLSDVHIVRWEQVRYCRLTQRYAETPSPEYAGDGVTVEGELPVVD